MKSNLLYLAFALAFCLVRPASAQVPVAGCGSETGGKIVGCMSHGCFGQYQAAPGGGQPQYQVSYDEVPCCGKLVAIPAYGDECESASLKSPEVKRRLDFLAENGIQIMVRGCQGHFVHYYPKDFGGFSYFTEMHLFEAGS